MAGVGAYHCYANLCNARPPFGFSRRDHLSTETSRVELRIRIGMKRARMILQGTVRSECAIPGDLLLSCCSGQLVLTKKAENR